MFIEKILRTISEYRGDYTKICARLRDLDSFKKPETSISEGSLRVTLSKLKKRGLLDNKKGRGKWEITPKGLTYLHKLKKRELDLPTHISKISSTKVKNMIIVFDIPEKERKKRSWLRIELTNLGFSMLQQSVWFGPAPLPDKFIESLDYLKLLPYLKFFKATEADIV